MRVGGKADGVWLRGGMAAKYMDGREVEGWVAGYAERWMAK